MKKYKLKQWYPSLYDDLEVGTVVDYEDDWIYYTNKRGNRTTIEMDEEELSYEDFWELIEEKELLFITEDGIKIIDHRTAIILVDADFMKQYKPAIDCNINTIVATTKLFFHESNADEYILWNKPMFSLQDIDFTFDLNLEEFEKLEQLAIERVNGKI